jgi:UDP-N-acetylglucosamine transferase subunit ALG13
MQFPEVIESMQQAEAVVCHAGAGSILCAFRAGHMPVVVPRMKRYGETVDDHQVELARALAGEGKVLFVDELERLAEVVSEAPPRQPPEQREGLLPIQAAVREALRAPLLGPA